MKIAIHENQGGFAEHWINYCKEKAIPYKIVDCYSNTIIQDIADCDALMMHPLQFDYKAEKFYKQLVYSIEQSGKIVFPNFRTLWHFDDKVGQKYLLEAINAPLAPSYVFYSEKEAMAWIENTEFPKVFKLRGGGGSSNVMLVKSKWHAIRLISRSFGKGHPQYNKISNLKERIRKFKSGKVGFIDLIKGVFRLFYIPEYARVFGNDKGYAYFQDFIPSNTFDIRIVVIGNKAFGIKRMNRKNDFRASGSGNIIYDKKQIDEGCVKIAFETNQQLKTQSIAYDFIFDTNNNPLIVEISYGFVPTGYYDCEGFWDNNLVWHSGKFNPYGWMIENLIHKLQFATQK